jgi:PLP dependent protein
VEKFGALNVRGLMTMPPYPLDPEDSRPLYKELAALSNSVREKVPGAREISMGMTRDFEVAVEEGATMVRVGEAVFGPRNRQ